MKRKYKVSSLVLSSLLLMGCGSLGAIHNTPEDKSKHEVYNKYLPAVKEYMEGLNINSDIEMGKGKDYEYIKCINDINKGSELLENKVLGMHYGIEMDDSVDLCSIIINMNVSVNADKIKKDGFDFKNTAMYDFSKSLGVDDEDCKYINEKIEEYYNGNGDIFFNVGLDNVNCVIVLGIESIQLFMYY